MPDDMKWAGDRTYFLHDVFTGKAFKEAGLVTAAKNVSRSQRVRRWALGGAGALGAAAILGWTYFGVSTLDQGIGRRLNYLGPYQEAPAAKRDAELPQPEPARQDE